MPPSSDAPPAGERDPSREILAEQQAYYRARAPEYDEFFLRRGPYDEGPEENARWFAEVEEVRAALAGFAPAGDVLELAAGTGWWTAELVRQGARVTALDGAPETLAVNRARLAADAARVEYVVGDVFTWEPGRTWDAVFFGFWLSHVPADRFDEFWGRVAGFLRPGGRVFFVDSLQPATAAARARPRAVDVTVRRLNDGREFRIVKVFHEPAALAARLAALGWDARVRATPTFFLHGQGALRR